MKFFVVLSIILIGLTSVACAPITKVSGFVPIQKEVDQLKIGFSTKEEVLNILGEPLNFSQNPSDSLLYVQQKFEKDYPELNFADTQMKVLKEDFDNMVKHTVDRVSNQMAERRETLLSVLATTSNIAPFLGVLGTVVGIINAFTAIGNMGSADLSVVAPAISEALVATALGIFVAIPSSAAFNMIGYWTQILGQKFDRFTMILLNRMQLELISRYKKAEEFGKF